MRHQRMVSVLGAISLGLTGMATATSAAAAPADSSSSITFTTGNGDAENYVVLAERGGSAASLAKRLKAAGAKVTSVNEDVGMVTVSSSDGNFAKKARSMNGVYGAASEGIVGHAPEPKKDAVERPGDHPAFGAGKAKGNADGPGSNNGKGKYKKGTSDPLDDRLWGMDMINAKEAHKTEAGDKRVKVGVIDTGVDASHPDIAPNFDHKLSRNFVTDIPEIDGPCEYDGCVDPADVDNGGHGTHVAGTIAGAMNGRGVSGVAPDAGIVNIRAGQDAGYFFVGPTVNALTYAADNGIDVVNMSFYVDPWAYYCHGGAPEDSPEEAAEQDMIIESVSRALDYAHEKDVTLVGALGNAATDLGKPSIDSSSPNYPEGNEHDRTIDPANCLDLPTQHKDVIGVSAVGPSKRKAYYSNYTTDLESGQIEVAAPGGDAYDWPNATGPKAESMILSSVPENVVKSEGSVDEDGNVVPEEEGFVIKDCADKPGKGKNRGESCAYYEYYQGTSMASPHAAGVAALIVSRYGKVHGKAGFGLDADTVRDIMMGTAQDTACPEPSLFDYPAPIPDSYNAQCTGDVEFNGFYGDGIIDAAAAVTR